jgi:hypothetical protein
MKKKRLQIRGNKIQTRRQETKGKIEEQTQTKRDST